MYDFSSEHADDAGVHPLSHGKPRLALTMCEPARLVGEYTSSLLWDALRPSSDVGAGRPVLVIPGFAASDRLTGRVRAHLRHRGFQVHGWGLGRNHGLTDELVDGLLDRFDQLSVRHGQPITVVGWSFGGLLGRWLAHERTDQVRQVVCLGSPWRAEGERTRATALFERARVRHGLSDRARDIVDTLREPVPVMCTALYSHTDGVVPWRGCRLDEGPLTENITLPSSHVGLVSNPIALAVLSDRLSQDPAGWREFSWARCLGRELLPGPGSPRGAEASPDDRFARPPGAQAGPDRRVSP